MRHQLLLNLLQQKSSLCENFAVNGFVATSWRDVECKVHHEREVGKELHPYVLCKWCEHAVIQSDHGCDLYSCLARIKA